MMRRRIGLLSLALVAVAVLVGSAIAYFSSTGSATAHASIGSVNAPSNVTAQPSSSTIAISWSAASLSTGGAVQGYRVTRSDSTTICGSPTLVTTLSCTDTAPTAGSSYTYTVVAVYHGFSKSATSNSVTFLTAPTLSATPSNPSASSAPSFSFSGGGGTGYECAIDAGSFSSCTSPKAYTSLSDGSHTFKVHATKSGTTGPDATYTWTIDSSQPSITTKPSNPSATGAPAFSFSHTRAGYTFKCQLDSGGFSTCTTPKSYAGLADGPHTFQLEGVSADGAATQAASYTWTVTASGPTISTKPSNPSASASASFTFSDGSYASFSCQLDAGSVASCNSGTASYSSVSDGSHSFKVYATASDGSQTTATTYAWTVDTSAPSITVKPANPSNTAAPSFSFSHAQSGYTFKCQLDSGGFSTCTSPKPYSSVADGSHTFQVEGVSGDGAVSSAASYAWVIDTLRPNDSLTLASGASGAFLTAGGGTLYYKGNASGSFKLVDTVADSGSGPASATFPAIGTTGWTHATETVSAPTGGPYTSSTFSWTAGPSNPVGYTVNSKDLAGNTSTGATPTFVNDSGAPISGALSVNGTAASAGGSTSNSTSTSFIINSRTDYTDAGSGIASSTLTVQSETLSNNTCGSPGSGGPFTTATTITGTTQPSGITGGSCYVYTLTGTDNVGNATSVSSTVKVDSTQPTDSLSLAANPSGAFLSGGSLYYKSNASGSFKLVDTVTADGSGASSATFPAIGTAGWTHGTETVSTPSGGPFTSSTLSWTASPTNPANLTVTSKNGLGATSSGASLAFVADAATPTGGAVSVNGTAATGAGSSSTSTSTSFAINSRADYTDAGSGIASSALTVQSATLTGTTCGAAGSGGPFTSATTITGTTQPSGTLAGFCYLYTLTGTDNVGNAASVKTTVQVPAPVSVVSVIAANGGTTHKIGAGDTVTIMFSGGLNESTMCSAWSGTGGQSIGANNAVTVTLTDGGAGNDTLNVSTTSCTFHLGTIDLGSTAFIASGTQTYSGSGPSKSTLTYSGNTGNPTLTILLGGGTDSASVTSSTLTYTPDANIKDANGLAITGGSSTGQSF